MAAGSPSGLLPLNRFALLIVLSSMVWKGAASAPPISYTNPTLSTEQCNVEDMNSYSGDDGGLIWFSPMYNKVYYEGDQNIVRYSAGSHLTYEASFNFHLESVHADPVSGQIYQLMSGSDPLTSTSTFTAVKCLGADLVETSTVQLSSSLTLSNPYSVYIGDQALIVRDNQGDWQLVSLACVGTLGVASLGSGQAPPLRTCERGRQGGMLEFDGISFYIYYARNDGTVWRRVINGPAKDQEEPLVSTQLRDICSLSFDYGSSRWYFHAEGLVYDSTSYAESLASCPANFLATMSATASSTVTSSLSTATTQTSSSTTMSPTATTTSSTSRTTLTTSVSNTVTASTSSTVTQTISVTETSVTISTSETLSSSTRTSHTSSTTATLSTSTSSSSSRTVTVSSTSRSATVSTSRTVTQTTSVTTSTSETLSSSTSETSSATSHTSSATATSSTSTASSSSRTVTVSSTSRTATVSASSTVTQTTSVTTRSTTTVDLSTPELAKAAVGVLLEADSAAEREAVTALFAEASNQSRVLVTPSGTVVSLALSPNVSEGNKDPWQLSAPASNAANSVASVSIPSALLGQLSRNGPIGLALGQLSDEANQVLEAAGMKSTSTPLSITLYGPDGNELNAVQLPEPILLTLRANATEDDQCVFWEPTSSMWSTEGITRVHDGSSNLVCATNHLSLFGSIVKAFVRTLVCSNIRAIFSLEGLENLVRSPSWTIRAPAMTLWGTLLLFACVLFRAGVADVISHETTLTAEEAHHHALHKGRSQQQNSSVISTIWNTGWQLNAFLGFCSTMARKFCSKESVSGLGRVPIQMQLDIIIRSRVGIGRQSLQKAGSIEMKRSGQNAVQNFRKSSFVAQAASLFKAKQPFLAAMRPNFELSHAARVAVLLTMLLGSSAASALFFATAGGAAGSDDPEECQSTQSLQEELVESCTIGILSGLFSGLPALAFLAVPRRRLSVQTRNAAIRYCSFWILLCSYGLLCLFVVATFLAKVTATDGNRWLISMLASAAQKLVLSPFILAVSMASYTSIAFRVNPQSAHQVFSQLFIDDDDEIANGPTLLRCPTLLREKSAELEPTDMISESADINGIEVAPCCTEQVVSHELEASVKMCQNHVLVECPLVDAYVSHAERHAGTQETQLQRASIEDKLQPARDELLASLGRVAINTVGNRSANLRSDNTGLDNMSRQAAVEQELNTFGEMSADMRSDDMLQRAVVEQECIDADVCRGETDAGNSEAQLQVDSAADNLQSDTCKRVVVEPEDVIIIPVASTFHSTRSSEFVDVTMQTSNNRRGEAQFDKGANTASIVPSIMPPASSIHVNAAEAVPAVPGVSSPAWSCLRDARAPSARYDEAEQDRVFASVSGPSASASRRLSSPSQRQVRT